MGFASEDPKGGMQMKSFKKWLKDNHNIEMPNGNVDAGWFAEQGLPMIVECKCCTMTMALPNAYIDSAGYTYCSDCSWEECK